MQTDVLAVLVALCGLGIVLFGVLLVALIVLIRMTGRNFLSFLTMLWRHADEEKEAEPMLTPMRQVDLRSRAQQIDFESAVAGEIMAQGQPVENLDVPRTTPTNPPPTTPNLETPFDDLQTPRLGSRRRGPRYTDQEVYGGMLDPDGDGDPDY